jgi:hypothetical protein
MPAWHTRRDDTWHQPQSEQRSSRGATAHGHWVRVRGGCGVAAAMLVMLSCEAARGTHRGEDVMLCYVMLCHAPRRRRLRSDRAASSCRRR